MWPALAAAQIPVLSVSPASLLFVASRAEAPPSQQVRIRNTGSGPLQWTVTPADPWARVSPSRGTGPEVLTITIDAARLGVGRHDSRLTIDAGDADDSPVSIPVTVEITAPVLREVPPAPGAPSDAPPAASAPSPPAEPAPGRPASGDLVPPRPPTRHELQLVRAMLPVATRNLPYAQAIPIAGGTPPYSTRLVRGRLPAGLTMANGAVVGTPRIPGFYPLTLAIADSARPPETLAGTLVLRVIVLLADTALAVNPPTFALVLPRGARQGRARMSITSGRQPLDWTASADVPWLAVTPPGGISPALVEIGIVAGSLPPGAYAGTVTVTMEGAPNSPARVPVTVTIPR
jgi:hypothetical protein